MLKTLRLHNFRTYLNAEFNFTQRHLLIGKNNAGKTNLCTALHFLKMTATTDLPTAASVVPGGAEEIANWAFSGKTVELQCTCEIPVDGHPHLFSYDLQLSPMTSGLLSREGRAGLRVEHERLVVEPPALRSGTLLENNRREAHMLHEESEEGYRAKTLAPDDATMLSKLYALETNRRAISFRRYLSSWQYFAVSPEAMRHGWRRSPAGPGPLMPRGDNLAVVLYHLKNMDERRYRSVLDHVRLVEPDLEAINFIITPDQAAVPFIALRTRHRASWNGLSDGTLRCLALACIVEAADASYGAGTGTERSLIMIEEPENGIFPGRLRKFFDLFEERAPDGQFLFTSHSPYFINLFDGYRDSVTLLRRAKEITEVVRVPPAEDDPDRELLAEQHSMELFD